MGGIVLGAATLGRLGSPRPTSSLQFFSGRRATAGGYSWYSVPWHFLGSWPPRRTCTRPAVAAPRSGRGAPRRFVRAAYGSPLLRRTLWQLVGRIPQRIRLVQLALRHFACASARAVADDACRAAINVGRRERHADAAPTEHKRGAAPAARAPSAARRALHQDAQRAARRRRPGVRHLEQAVAFSLAPASLAACCVETSLRASDLFEFELPPPERKFSTSSSQAPLKRCQRSATLATRWRRGRRAAPARRFAGRSSCSSGPDATSSHVCSNRWRMRNAGSCWRTCTRNSLDGWTAVLEAAARSALAAATTSATCLGWPPTTTSTSVARGARTSTRHAPCCRLAAAAAATAALSREPAPRRRMRARRRPPPRHARALLRWLEAAADAVADDGAADDPGGDSPPSRARQRAPLPRRSRCGGAARAACAATCRSACCSRWPWRPATGRCRLHAASDGDGGDAPPRAGARRYLWLCRSPRRCLRGCPHLRRW